MGRRPRQNVFRLSVSAGDRREDADAVLEWFARSFRVAGDPVNVLVACHGTTSSSEGGATFPVFVTVGTPHDREEMERALDSVPDGRCDGRVRLCPPPDFAPAASVREGDPDV